MKKFPLILLTLFLAYVPAPLFADEDLYTQYLPEYMPQAPNAQAIARAIEIPVNFYTGIPNISIPLYDIKVGNISVPITLSYQGGGIRPSQEATSVGLGWNLNAGGAITRTVKCADDFMEYYVSNSQFTVGFFGRSGWPDFSINFDYNYYRKVQHGYDGLTPYWTYHLYVDSEPDLFFYNIPGCSGKFSFKKDMSILNFDEENHVDINFTPQVNYFYVIDAQGTSYWFETKERTEVYSGGDCSNINSTPGGVDITAFGPNDHLTEVSEYTSTWYLTKIVSATNDTVDFEYEDETFMLPIQENCYYLRRVEGAAWNQDGDGPQYSRTKTNVDSKRLTHIRWRGGYVNFEYDKGREDLVGDSKALTAVKVYNSNNLLVSHWKMSYGYFNNTLTGIANNRKHLFKRLRLNSVKDMLSPQDPYQFGYYDEVDLPLKNTKNLDYWGYYNGVNQGNNYYCPATHNIIQSSKSANDHYSKVGILESIKHPTGGTTNLYWECNKTGESIFIENSITSGNHDSYTRGCLHAYRGGSTYDEERKKAVLLTEQSEIYLLLTTHYSGSQPSTTPIGTPFSIVKVNNDGTRTPCHSWSRGCVSDESEHTVTLAPGIYEFKCSATADDMEYYMYFTDSKNKFATRKSHDELIFCYRGTELTGIPDTVSQTVTLNRGEVVFLNYFSETVGNVTVSDLSDTSPFSIHRRKTDGTYEQVTSWTIPGVNMDENMTMHLDAGTYRIQCNAVADNVALGMTLQYGDVQYSPVNMNSLYHDWTSKVLLAYSEGTVSNEFDLEEEESDTITLLKPSRLYFDWFYEDMTGSAVSPSLMNTQPVSVYKRLASGTFEKLFCIPASSFADIDDIGREASGLYLPAGTYVVKCEATDDDIIFCASFAYKSDGIYSNNGANRGGLRIARISGEKDVTYLYEGGKEIIPPCTFYKEKRWYEHEGITSEVTYEVQPSESVRTLSTLKNGNVIGYSRVVQVFADKSRMEYRYHNEEEELVDAEFPYSPTLTDWENGLLQTETVFNAEGDTVSHASNAYMLKLVQPTYMFGFKEVRAGYNVNYFNKVECPLLSHAMTTEFRDNGKYAVRRKYLYNDNLLCTEVSTTIGQDVQKTVYKYADDFTDDVSQQMLLSHQIGVPVAQLSIRNGVFYSGTRSVFGEFGQLSDNGNTLLLGGSPNAGATYQRICQPRMLLTLNTSTATGSFSSCQFDTIIVYNGYTRFGKVRDLVYKGMPISYVWSYEGLFPVAEFKNATYQQFYSNYGGGHLDRDKYIYQDPEFIKDRIWGTANQLTGAAVTINLQQPLVGVTSITNNSGITHTYGYDTSGRLISANWVDGMTSSPETLQTYTYAKNLVRTTECPTTDILNSISSVQHYDSWGRPSVVAAQGTQQNGAYSYTMQTYDQLGRPSLAYVPVPSNSQDGAVIDSMAFVALSANAFSGDHFGYSKTKYDALGRTVENTTPGAEWYNQGKSTSTHYLTNQANEVRRYGVSGNSVCEQGYYAAGTLDCTSVTDPDGQTVKTYKDVFGNVVLERRAGNYDTYYVYDALNRLRFVLPPKYQIEPNLDYYAYRYEYDGRGRVTKKQLPGCSPVQYWYDSRDRLVRMQDGVLAQTGSYRVWTYDALDRRLTQSIQQSGGLSQNEMCWYYDNYSFTSNYTSLLPSSIANLLPIPNSMSRGLLTGTWQLANNGEPMLTVLGYNGQGFLSKKTESGIGGRISVSDFENNLAGMVTEEQFRQYVRLASGTMQCVARGSIENNFDYLHTKLPSSSVITIYDKNENMRTDTILHQTYDAFGHVMTNDRGGTVADMTYGYDPMHGWLTSIRSAGGFEQKLYRETEGSTPCYNGNISAMTWRTGNDYVRRFDYSYNGMNWLQSADFSYYRIGNPTSPSPTLSLMPYVGMDHEDYTSEYYYDKNGNLTGAYRQGLTDNVEDDPYHNYDTMDDYDVEYYGNQRRSVNGTGTGTPSYYGSSSFVDGMEDGDDEYAYNANGAMTKDLNKGITDISYDQLGNLQTITLSGNRSIRYVYAADGTRLRTVHTKRVGNAYVKDSTDYCGSLIMKNSQPIMYQFAGGYISFANSLLSDCHYYIQDYLGSNRMVVNKAGAVKQITHYYPYGGIIGGIDKSPSYQQYKFEGKELDRTYGLDWYDIQARQYDPVVPSWHTVDPLAEKYYWISPYAYCANNPVNYMDLHGDSIFIGYEHQQEILEMINNVSEGVFDVNENGYLYLKHQTKPSVYTEKFSKYYQDQLVYGINSSNTISVQVASEANYKGNSFQLDNYGQGLTIVDNDQAYVYVSGESHTTQSGTYCNPSIILAHELAGHAIPSVTNSYMQSNYDGLAVSAENAIRSEIGLPLRNWGNYEENHRSVNSFINPIGRIIINRQLPIKK